MLLISKNHTYLFVRIKYHLSLIQVNNYLLNALHFARIFWSGAIPCKLCKKPKHLIMSIYALFPLFLEFSTDVQPLWRQIYTKDYLNFPLDILCFYLNRIHQTHDVCIVVSYWLQLLEPPQSWIYSECKMHTFNKIIHGV